MGRLDIWVIDHRGAPTTSTNAFHAEWARVEKEQADPGQPEGEIIKKWNPRLHGSLDEKFYAETTAVHGAWKHYTSGLWDQPEFIGFWGYRKYLWQSNWFSVPIARHCDQAPGWFYTARPYFDAYRNFLSTWNGVAVKDLLAQCDILQAEPYTYTEMSSLADFAKYCGSATATATLFETLKKHGCFDYPLS